MLFVVLAAVASARGRNKASLKGFFKWIGTGSQGPHQKFKGQVVKNATNEYELNADKPAKDLVKIAEEALAAGNLTFAEEVISKLERQMRAKKPKQAAAVKKSAQAQPKKAEKAQKVTEKKEEKAQKVTEKKEEKAQKVAEKKEEKPQAQKVDVKKEQQKGDVKKDEQKGAEKKSDVKKEEARPTAKPAPKKKAKGESVNGVMRDLKRKRAHARHRHHHRE